MTDGEFGGLRYGDGDDDTAVIPRVRRRRGRAPLIAGLAATTAIGVALITFAIVGLRGSAEPAANVATATASATAVDTLPSPTDPPSGSPSTRPSPSRSPSRSPSPKPTKKKVTTPVPPAPKPSPVAGCTKPFYVGTNAPMATVKSALETAAGTNVWTVSQVSLPPDLIKAIAWQESGWQSAIRACDGGIGTMQVMPGTASMMNQRFGANWDVTTLAGNTMIGSAYLQWLIKYFGDAYFNSDYTLDAAACVSTDPTVPDYKTPCLLNAVIAAYNYGAGAVGQDTIVIPNPQYVSDVRALMVSCPCAKY